MTKLLIHRHSIAGTKPFLLALCVSVWLLVGCKTSDSNPQEPLASVQIEGNTPGQISQTTVDVFERHGYTLARKRSGSLVFEKPTGKLGNLAYGDWMGTDVWTRAKIAIVPAGETAARVECNAFYVQDKGTSVEEERRISGSGSFQKLLNEIASRFKQ